MKRVMVDLETLDVKDTAKILSIGAVEFNEYGGIERQFYANISPTSYLYLPEFTESARTVQWWEEQDKEARLALLVDRSPVRKVINSFSEWIMNIGPSEVWACPPSFDITILETHFRKLGVPIPWDFWSTRCYRTLREAYKYNNPGWHAPESLLEHHALEDAKAQALGVAYILDNIAKEKKYFEH